MIPAGTADKVHRLPTGLGNLECTLLGSQRNCSLQWKLGPLGCCIFPRKRAIAEHRNRSKKLFRADAVGSFHPKMAPGDTTVGRTPAWARCPRSWSGSRTWVSGGNGAENPFKGYESSKPDQKYLFQRILGLSRACSSSAKANLFTSPEIRKYLKIRPLVSDRFPM
jgi:hypothetical protein